jgi:cytochrome c-type biogenesis protein CcmH/NrfG
MESAPDELAADVETVPGGRSSWLTPAVGWTAGTVAFVALAWVVMSQALSPRAAGDTMTGSLPGRGVESSAGVPVADVDPERLAALEAMVAENPNDVEALVALGHLYLRLQRNDELTAVTQRALELDPDNPEALTHMGMLLFSMQHPEGVMPSFDRALAVDPDFPEALFLKGMVSFMRQDYAAAVGAWEHYLEVVPTQEVPPRLLPMLEMARANVGSANSQ